MADDAASFRARARDCRDLAAKARDQASRRELAELAEQLDAEADKIDAEQVQQPMPPPGTRQS